MQNNALEMLPWSCYDFMSGFSMLWCSSWLVIPVFVLPHMSEICAFKFGTHTCSLPIATKQYLLVWPASVSSSGIVMPEEDTHTRVICPNKHWKYVERSETVTVSIVLMTNMFISTSFFQLATRLKDLFGNLYTKHVFQSTNSICLTFLSRSPSVFSCVKVYISRPKPVARWLLFMDVGVPCLSGVNTDEDQGGGAIPGLEFSLSKKQAFNLFLITLTISRWHTSFLALTSLWLMAKKLFRIQESLWITNTREWERTKEE